MIGAPARASDSNRFEMSAPPGFDDPAAERDMLLDVYFGGRIDRGRISNAGCHHWNLQLLPETGEDELS